MTIEQKIARRFHGVFSIRDLARFIKLVAKAAYIAGDASAWNRYSEYGNPALVKDFKKYWKETYANDKKTRTTKKARK